MQRLLGAVERIEESRTSIFDDLRLAMFGDGERRGSSVSRAADGAGARGEHTSTIVTSTSAPAHAWRCQSSYGEIA